MAQDVKAALKAVKCDDFAGWTLADKNDLSSEQGLRYNELIAPLIKAVQELNEQIKDLQE
jgi:hypothetical protein